MRRHLWTVLFAASIPLWLGGCGAGGAIDDAIDSVASAGGSGGGSPPAATMSPNERSFAMEVFSLVNTERQKAGSAPLVWDEAAAAAAYAHAVDMDVRDYFDHDDPDGLDPGHRLATFGIKGRGWGENIAQGQPDSRAVMDDWMTSEGHRRNILEPAFGSIGIGVHFGKLGPWWVEDFLTP